SCRGALRRGRILSTGTGPTSADCGCSRRDLEPKLFGILELLHKERQAISDAIGRTVVRNIRAMAQMGLQMEQYVPRHYPGLRLECGKRSSGAGVPASSCVNGSQESPFSVTHTMSATSPLRVRPTRSVRRTSGLVLAGNPSLKGLNAVRTLCSLFH